MIIISIITRSIGIIMIISIITSNISIIMIMIIMQKHDYKVLDIDTMRGNLVHEGWKPVQSTSPFDNFLTSSPMIISLLFFVFLVCISCYISLQ